MGRSRQLIQRVFARRLPGRWGKVLLGFLLLLVLGVIGVNIYLKSTLNSRLRTIVHKASHGVYRLEYSGLRVNILTGRLVIKNVELKADTAVLAQLRRQNAARRIIVEAKTEKLSFTNIRWFTYLLYKKLTIGKLAMEQPELSVTHFKHDSTADTQNRTDVTKQLNDLRIGLFKLENAVIHYQAIDSNQERTVNTIGHLNLNLSDIHIMNGTNGAPRVTVDDYSIAIKEYKRNTADSMYEIGFKGLEFSSKKQKGALSSFYAKPRYTEREFAKKYTHQQTSYNVSLNNISIEGVNIDSLFNDGAIVVKKLAIGSGATHMFMDRSRPPVNKDDGEVVISKKVAKLFVPIALEQIHLNKLEISYSEYNPRSDQIARLVFQDMSIRAHNLTNVNAYIRRNNEFTVDLTGRFLNAGVRANFMFDQSSPEGRFTAKVITDQIAADQLNPVLTAIAKIEARKGILKQLEASVTGNENEATANVNLQYQGLKINILQKEGDTLKKKGIKTMLANLFVMDDNPKDGVLRTANSIRRQRPPGKSFFNMFWGAIAAGIKDIITDKKGFGTEVG